MFCDPRRVVSCACPGCRRSIRWWWPSGLCWSCGNSDCDHDEQGPAAADAAADDERGA